MAGMINTSAVLNNGWNSGGNDQVFTGTISIDPSLEKNYDYALTSDPVLLQERQRTCQMLYDIFKDSPYFEKYGGLPKSENDKPFTKKIERSDIVNVFYYMKEELDKVQKLNITEIVMQICEFFELDYKFIVNNVLSVPLQARLMQEIYKSGHKKQEIENSEQLF